MKILKQFCLLLAALCLLGCLAGCADTAPDDETTIATSAEMTGRVKVVDLLGNAYTEGVIVRFLQNGEAVGMQVVDENGLAQKTLPNGTYTVELVSTDAQTTYYYDTQTAVVSDAQPVLELQVARNLSGEPQYLYAQSEDQQVYTVSPGCTYLPLKAGARNFVLFVPTQAGTYRFRAVGDVQGVGYYGAPYLVQENSLAEVTDGSFTVSVRADMIGDGSGGTSVLVLGVDAGDAESCIFTIERIGDPEWSVADEPWTIYQTTAALAAYTLPAGSDLREFDLTAQTDDYTLVYNEADGFYHMDSADGPLVLVRLTQPTDYLDSLQTVAEHSSVCKYFFDENGQFIKKESYTECLMEYFEYADEEYGVYPLTEDLKYIIQQRGDHYGWFDTSSSGYLFQDVNGNPIAGINNEISWLFPCCYLSAK